MRPRRIFAPQRDRRWGRLALGSVMLLGVIALATALPGDLLGSARRDQSWQASAAEVRVIDGDTLRLGERMVRLYAVDAPDRGTDCGNGRDCGSAAAAALAALVQGRDVDCRLQGRDRHGRALGLCRANGVEVNASLVAAGWALADTAALPSLAPLQATARDARRGVWGAAQIPETWSRR